MVIRKMNSVFARHGRILFGIITVAIIISFVGFLTPGFNGVFSHFGGSSTVGVVFGKKVSNKDVMAQARRNLIIYSLVYGAGMDNSRLMDFATQNAFPTICTIAAAQDRGITVSDMQVAQFIRKLPVFQNPETKSFDEKKFSNFVDNELQRNGLNASDLDQSVRELLMQQQLEREMLDSLVITPGEVKQFYNQFSETFFVRSARFTAKDFIGQVKYTDKEIKNFYESNKKAYTIPASYSALVVKFDYNSPEAQKAAAAKLSDKELKEFYQANKKSFMDFKPGQKPAVKPFAQVKDKVKIMMISERQKQFASDRAMEFSQEAYDKVGEAAKDDRRQAFLQLVNKNKLSPFLTGWFPQNAKSIKGLNEPELVKQIAEIYDAVPVSNAVAGQDAAYVAFLVGAKKARQAKFEEVKDQVVNDFKNKQAMKLARSACREAVAKLVKLDDKARIAAVDAMKTPAFKKVEPFKWSNPPFGSDGTLIVSLVEDVPAGGISKALNTTYGGIAVFVDKRELPNEKDFAKDKMRIEYYFKSRKYGAVKAAFTSWLESKCKKMR
ncbi:SurA N-terminal domain-containing protein [Lentisphaerota bacterium ZTH]|nr:SurA N-terminal domain-containing protein [Lentisphaerota bacterium]WET06217.1 SurA N-terminal domain-containing protein [Lentisphaerota bacterium ZTH]